MHSLHASVLIVSCALGDDVDLAAARAVLDEAEQARAVRFLRDEDRRRFVLAHALLRRVLARHLDTPPQGIRFHAGPQGKPVVCGGAVDLRFNLSHSGDSALVAIAMGREVGVDVERARPIKALELARAHFSTFEQAALERLPAAMQPVAFFRIWTRKESFVKAHGLGFSYPLQDFDVSLDEGLENLLLRERGDATVRDRWAIRELDAPPGYAAAVTAEGTDWFLVRERESLLWLR